VTSHVATRPERASDEADEPALSVVVVPFGGAERLEDCLRALGPQASDGRVEVVVPFDDRFEDVDALAARYPFARFARLAGVLTTAAVRAAGVRLARGRLVAITEDNCEPAPDWCARIVSGHDLQVCAVGGAVARDEGSGIPWAVYLADYGRYRPPLRCGPVLTLTDVNASYKRWALAMVSEVWQDEFHENEVNGALLAGGGCLWLDPDAVVVHNRTLTARAAIRDRYEFGRLFASGRVRGASFLRRGAFVLATPLLPVVILLRPLLSELRRGGRVSTVLRAAPALATIALAWSFGELLGYLTGRPGTNATRSVV
jgi:hypothetical protein